MSTARGAGAETPPWYVFGGTGPVRERLARLGEPPPWRKFSTRREHLAESYLLDDRIKRAVNAALYLRRPLLVTGSPGSGKSSLAYAVARNLDLGPVLRWPINSRSTLLEGLYSYDVIARLRDAELAARLEAKETRPAEDVGKYIRLNPLGTALYGAPGADSTGALTPRVLLIDEIDKSDIDLPNDLLNVLEEGEFEIVELARIADRAGMTEVEVETTDILTDQEEPPGTAGGGQEPRTANARRKKVKIERGVVSCRVFPFVLITSNAERELPPAFLRRCLQLELAPETDFAQLKKMVEAHLGLVPSDDKGVKILIETFKNKRESEKLLLANDQLLNAVFLILKGQIPESEERGQLIEFLLRELNS